MEVFFYDFLNFFAQAAESFRREEEEPEQEGRSVGRQAQEETDRRAQQEEVEHGPQRQGRPHVDAHHAAAHGGGIDKEPAGGQDPEAQIQQAAQQRQPEPLPEDPEHVVHQAQAAPQGRRPQEGAHLVGQVDAHGPTGTAGPGSPHGPRRRPHR